MTRNLSYVQLDLTCCDKIVATFDLLLEPDDVRPAVHADSSHVYETAPGLELESEAAEYVLTGEAYMLAEGLLSEGVIPKWHVECPTCHSTDVQLTEPRLLELLRPIRAAYVAGWGPQALAMPVRRVGGLK